MTLSKNRLIVLLSQKTKHSKPEAKNLVEDIISFIKEDLKNGKDVKISGFGKWSIKAKKRRPGRNPQTGGRIEISARKVILFHSSKKFDEKIKGSCSNAKK